MLDQQFSMLEKRFCIFLTIFVLTCWCTGMAQGDEGLIFGEVTLKNNDKYRGHIRWGKEKVMWNDILYSRKMQNTVHYFLTGEEVDRLELSPEKGRQSWNFLDLWDPALAEEGSLFKMYFGSIRQIDLSSERGARGELKNGSWIRIAGEMDMDKDLHIYDGTLGEHRIRLKDVKHIGFVESPALLPLKHGDPIYGTVRTRDDTFTGFILWNNECCLTDIMYGKSNNRTEKHLYSSISAVRKLDKEFEVSFRDGSQKKLCCTDDLNRGKLSIIVKNQEYGHIEIKMNDIEMVTFRGASMRGQDYKQYGLVSRLMGRIVTTDNDVLRGRIIFDLDEAFSSEILDGEHGGYSYKIPFNLIRKIIPQGTESSDIILKKGAVIRLSRYIDVDEQNRGCLLETPKGEYIYVPWNNIREITFQN